MTNPDHYRQLERMFQSGPINQTFYSGTKIEVSERQAKLELEVNQDFFHAAAAMHGSVYFKMMDDAAYFAAASIEETFFILTHRYEIEFLRPVEGGTLRAMGQVLSQTEKEIIATAELFNEKGKLVGRGKGRFVRGPKRLDSLIGYH